MCAPGDDGEELHWLAPRSCFLGSFGISRLMRPETGPVLPGFVSHWQAEKGTARSSVGFVWYLAMAGAGLGSFRWLGNKTRLEAGCRPEVCPNWASRL